MSTTTHPILLSPITTLAEAEAFLTYLYEHGMSYHCEDSATECIAHLITAVEAVACDTRMDECYQQDWPADQCPCGFVLELDPDNLRNMIANRKGDLEIVQHDADGRDLTADENRECGELIRDIERLESLLVARESAAKCDLCDGKGYLETSKTVCPRANCFVGKIKTPK